MHRSYPYSALQTFARGNSQRITQIHELDYGDIDPVKGTAVDADFSGDLSGLAAIDEYRGRIGLRIAQATLLCSRLSEEEAPGIELELPLISSGAECNEGLRRAEEKNGVVRQHVDVAGWLVHQRAERDWPAAACA
jgi:hypothetical protein